jgi:hypothetical protein
MFTKSLQKFKNKMRSSDTAQNWFVPTQNWFVPTQNWFILTQNWFILCRDKQSFLGVKVLHVWMAVARVMHLLISDG